MKKKVFKITLFSVLGIITLVVLFFLTLFLACVIEGYTDESECLAEQDRRIEELKTSYENGTAEKVDEQSFCDFDIDDAGNIKYNRLRTLGTHNSYKKSPSKSGELVMNIVFPLFANGVGGENSYHHENLTYQLNNGLRTFELDAIKSVSGGQIKIMSQHSPFFDGNSWTLDLAKGFREMVMWSNYNKGHMPITILIEGKTDFLLKVGTSPFDKDALGELEKIVVQEFGDKLITPKDMLGSFGTFKNLRENDGYKSLLEMKDKVMVILHPSDLTEKYIERPVSDVKLFAAAGTDKDVLFTLMNEPYYENDIRAAVKNKFLVRTRIDKYLEYSDERTAMAMRSNAQILSSDYVPRKIPIENQYICLLHNKYTMSLISQ